MIIKTLYAISKATNILAKTLEKSSKATDALIEKEYIFKALEGVKSATGKVVEKVGYTIGQVEETIAARK